MTALINISDQAVIAALNRLQGAVEKPGPILQAIGEDIMARTWEHENEIHGFRRKNDVNRRPVNPVMRPGQESQSRVNTRSSISESVSI